VEISLNGLYLKAKIVYLKQAVFNVNLSMEVGTVDLEKPHSFYMASV